MAQLKTVVNVKQLQRKSLRVTVRKVKDRVYIATSLENPNVSYTLTVRGHSRDFRVKCSCPWGTKHGEGCVHAMAVIRYMAAKNRRRVSFWNTWAGAKNQKHKMLTAGKHLWITTYAMEED